VRRRPAIALLAAAACAGLAALVWVLAFHTNAGHTLDLWAFDRGSKLRETPLELPLEALAALCNAVPYALLALLVLGVGYARYGGLGTLVLAAVLVVPNAVTQWLKPVTAEDRVGPGRPEIVHVDPASWPSGHSTAAMVIALAAVIAAPAGLRAVVTVVGLAFAALVGAAVVGLGWHFPSDVVGGYLVAGAGAAAGFSLLETRAAPRGRWLPARG
jgi:membrane-associated phospholipid phosphatase